jgi:methanogenic corrinoid protein MtbC1
LLQSRGLYFSSASFDSTPQHNWRAAPLTASSQGSNLANCYLEILLRNKPEDSVRYVEGLCGEGLSLCELYLGLLAPAARMLGERWLSEEVSFSAVTLASWRLEQVLRHFAEEFEERSTPQMTPQMTAPMNASTTARTTVRPSRGTLLVAILPGEQHTFGARMLVSFFRRSGWDASLLQAVRHSDIAGALASRRIDVLALSLSQREALADLAPLVRRAREASLRPELRVLVGGRAVIEAPELASRSGASVCTGEADQAVELASRRDN